MSIETIKVLVEALEYHQAQTRPIQRTAEALAAGRAAIAGAERQEPAVLPKAGTAEAEAAIRSMLRRYEYPSNSQNAGRAGWEAARRYFEMGGFPGVGKTMLAPTPPATPQAAPPQPVKPNGPVELALAEVAKATTKFPTWPTDPLHALAVLGEEFGELTKDTLQLVYEPHKTNLNNVRAEAIQTAAMALRFLASVDSYEFKQGTQHAQEPIKGAA